MGCNWMLGASRSCLVMTCRTLRRRRDDQLMWQHDLSRAPMLQSGLATAGCSLTCMREPLLRFPPQLH